MSFYGNVFYSYSNAFKYQYYENIKVTQDNTADSRPSSAESAEADKYTLDPKGRDDGLTMKAGNKWIRFYASNDDKALNRINIFHRLANKDQYGTYTTLQPQASSSNGSLGDVNLKFDNILTIPQITFDRAGHIVESRMTEVHIPMPEGTEDIKELKRRIAQLEEYLTGEHGDNGEEIDPGTGEQPDPNDWTEVEENEDMDSSLANLEKKINAWEMGAATDGNPPGSTNRQHQETIGIGSALHQLMVTVGTRKEISYTVQDDQGNVENKTGYDSINNNNYDPTSILGQLASTKMYSTYAVDNRRVLNSISNYLNEELNSDPPGSPGFVEYFTILTEV